MIRLIKVTEVRENDYMLINIDSIVKVTSVNYVKDGNTKIDLKDGKEIFVVETLDTIKKMCNK